MYMRTSLAALKPGMGDAWRRMVDGYDPVIRQLPGFVAVTYYCDDEAGLAGSLSVWQSKEAAEAAAARIDDKTHEITASMYHGTPTVQVLQVYEPAR